jgi:multiple sugar transport system permease protein
VTLRKRDSYIRYYLLLPALTLLFVTTIVPIIYMVYTSLFRLDPIVFNRKWPFVGLQNYIDLFTKDPMFWSSLWRTLLFLVYSVAPQILVGLLLATLLYEEFKGKRAVQTILLFPILATPIIVAMIWKYFFDFDTGFLNVFLRNIGAQPQPWLSTRGLPFWNNIPFIGEWLVKHFYLTYAFRTIAFVNFWQWTPFCFLVFYSGMTALPSEVYEAARIDGASSWKIFKHITLPLLAKIIWAVTFIRIIDCLKVYAQIWVLFGNAESTRVINIHLYTLGFTTSDYGMTSALGVILILMISAAVALSIFIWRKKSD